MKLLVGCLVLGCISAVLVIAEDPVTETVETTPELATAVVAETPEPERQTRIFAKLDQASGKESQHEVFALSDHHDDHHHHHHPTEPPHHHHHTPPPHHHHHPIPTQPPHHHHYPPYYPPYYPPPYPYGAPVYAPVPQPYPYYPSPQYPPPPHMHVKPIAVIQAESDSNSGSGHNLVKPSELINQSTGYIWNLIDQKNNELWNFFGNRQGGNGGRGGGDKGESVVHEVVVSYETPGVGTTIGTIGHANGGNWFNKGRNIPKNDCNTSK